MCEIGKAGVAMHEQALSADLGWALIDSVSDPWDTHALVPGADGPRCLWRPVEPSHLPYVPQ